MAGRRRADEPLQDRRDGGGPTILHLQGSDAPAPTSMLGQSDYQGWDDGQLSYMWTPVSFDE